MKKKTIYPAFVFIFFFNSSFSQNLVNNGSFEDTVACPTGISEIADAVGWSSYRISPDYFNPCNNGQAGVPTNLFGYHYARTGNAYAGLIDYNSQIPNAREYMGVQLNQTLIVGTKYYASFFVSRAVMKNVKVNIATNKIGLQLSTIAYSASNPKSIDNYATIFTDSIITDTLNWIKVSGSFTADSAYRYIMIGNFFMDSLISFVKFDTISNEAYYYIDDICISTDSVTCNGIEENISEINNSSILIFPNPARDWIEIRGSEIQSLVLYDVLGRIIFFSNSVFASPIELNTSSYSRGIYFLQAKTKNTIVSKKIILQ